VIAPVKAAIGVRPPPGVVAGAPPAGGNSRRHPCAPRTACVSEAARKVGHARVIRLRRRCGRAAGRWRRVRRRGRCGCGCCNPRPITFTCEATLWRSWRSGPSKTPRVCSRVRRPVYSTRMPPTGPPVINPRPARPQSHIGPRSAAVSRGRAYPWPHPPYVRRTNLRDGRARPAPDLPLGLRPLRRVGRAVRLLSRTSAWFRSLLVIEHQRLPEPLCLSQCG